MPTIDAAPSLAHLVHNSDKTGAQQFPPCSQPPASTNRIVSHPCVAGASCGRRWARLFASITGSSKRHGSSSFRSSLSPAHSLQSANSLSTVACALTSLGQICRKSTSCPLAVTKVVWCGHVHPNCLRHIMMAPVGPLTLLRLKALCRAASSSCSSQTASAHATMGSTLHVCVGSHSCIASRQAGERTSRMLAWQASSNRHNQS